MLKSIYNKMWNDSLEKISRNELELDPFINDPDDKRRGITLQAKPGIEIQDLFNKFLQEAKKIEPDQYFYKQDEMHITILSIINCSKEFNLSRIFLPDYFEQIENSLISAQPFEIEFRGITASPSCILIQGFPGNNSLELIRNRLREEFAAGDIYNSIDARYRIKTAHCTVIRFIKELKDKQKFIRFLEDYRDYYFGKTLITKLELVYTDWYNKNDIVQVLQKFIL
jgi:2'-5' RNA ligase